MDCIDNILDDKFYEMNRFDITLALKVPVTQGAEFPLGMDSIQKAWPQSSVPASFEMDGRTESTDLISLRRLRSNRAVQRGLTETRVSGRRHSDTEAVCRKVRTVRRRFVDADAFAAWRNGEFCQG
ncbi:MAG: hypothetical protein LBU32_02330 [Clostridiales bacterium]|jgi:hypothetical protein|nr:hypothetical protein [Clostridiales bacterium]